MLLQPIQIQLKDGRKAVLRSPEVADAADLLAYITKACSETEFLARYPEEWASMPLEREQAWVQNRRESPNTLAIVCFVDGKLAGNCEVMFHTGMKTSHRATIAIAILQDYWALGIGSAMLEQMIKAAREHGTMIMELEFIEGNNRARALYEKFGFEIVGKKPNAIRQRDGRLLSEFLMQKHL